MTVGLLSFASLPVISTVTGNVNLNLGGLSYYGNIFPFINILKSSADLIVTNSNSPGVQFKTSIPQGASDQFGNPSTFGTYTDNNGEFLSPLPAGTNGASIIVYGQGTNSGITSGPQNFFGKSFTLDWTNSTDWTMRISAFHPDGTATNFSSTTSPLSFTWPSDCTGVHLDMIPGTLSAPPRHVRLYQTSLASNLTAGQICDPDYVASVAAGCIDFRCMDWMGTNNNTVANGIVSFNSTSAISWGNGSGFNSVNNNSCSLPMAPIIELASRANKQPWVCLPDLIGSPKVSQGIQSIDPTNGVTVTTYGPHNWANGDQFIFPASYNGSIPYVINPTAYNAGSNSFTTTAPGLANNTPIIFGLILSGASDTSTYPTGITKGTVTYYTVNCTSTSFQIAATPGGAPITLSGSMTGTINVYQQGGRGIAFGRNVILTSYAASVWTLNAHPFVNNQPLIFGVQAGAVNDSSTYPTATGFNPKIASDGSTVTVYVVNATANTFQVSLTKGGAPISFSGSMTGTINVWLTLYGNTFTVANTNPSANKFDLSGPGASTLGFWGQLSISANSGNTNGLNSSIPYLFQPFNLSYLSSAVAAFVAPFQTGLPSTIPPIFEHVNEKWNPGFFSWHTNDSLAKNNPALVNAYFASGYYMCAVAKAIYDAYGGTPAGKAKYRMMFSSNQTSFASLLSSYTIPGALHYLTDIGSNLTLANLFDYLTVTSYFQTCYSPNAGVSGSQGTVAPCTFNVGANTVAITAGYSGDPSALLGSPVKFHATAGALPTGVTDSIVGTNSNAHGSALVVGSGSGSTVTYTQTVYGTPGTGATVAGPGVPAGTTILTVSTGSFTTSNPVSFPAGTQIFIGSPFAPGTGTIYYLVGNAPNFGISTTRGGAPITLSGTATGTYACSYCPTDVVYSLIQQSLSLHGSSPGTYPDPWTYYAQSISDDIYDGRWTNANFTITSSSGNPNNSVTMFQGFHTNYLAAGKPLAGLGLMAYEGGDGSSAQNGFELYNDPTWRWFQIPTEYGVGAGTNFSQMYTASTGLLARTSQFSDAGAYSYNQTFGNYGARQYITDNNPRWQAIVSTNALSNAPL